MVEFRILGPLEANDGTRVIALDAPKQRALLSLLLLHANEVVSSERMIDELWGEKPPATANKVVQTYVSHLRRLLGPALIATRPPGYMLCIEEDTLDVASFRRLTFQARTLAVDGEPEHAAALYRQALALWRGPPLPDVAFESFARNEVERLGEERLDALTARIDCELALGRHEQLVVELETLAGQYPLRERFRAQLMLALYRSGRQADALAAYQDARRVLAEELGLEPSRELQDMERAILTHDPALEPPPRDSGHPVAENATVGARSHLRRARPALVVIPLLLLGVALGVILVFGQGKPGSVQLAPDSVGFIDAESSRVTKSYPVGREPRSLVVAANAVWVANHRDGTVTRIDPETGPPDTIPVGGHPTGLTSLDGTIWVWTLESLLVPIDSRFTTPGTSISLARWVRPGRKGGITSGGGFLWLTSPRARVLRVDPDSPRTPDLITPDNGAEGAITYRNGEAWVGGFTEVFPIADGSDTAGGGISVGWVHDLTFGMGSLWVIGGAPSAGIAVALRRVDVAGGLLETTIPAVGDPVAVAAAAGSIWVADRSGRAVLRVDPAENHVVATIPLGRPPVAIAGDADGVWVSVD